MTTAETKLTQIKPIERIVVKKKNDIMTDEERRTYVMKQKEKAWKTYEYWKRESLKANLGTWTKEDIELIDLAIEKDNG